LRVQKKKTLYKKNGGELAGHKGQGRPKSVQTKKGSQVGLDKKRKKKNK